MRKAIAFMVMAALVIMPASVLAGGCGSGSTATAEISFKDDSGKTFTLDEPAKRVVSLAPSNTEIVYWLGAQDKLVGVTTYCDYPAEAKKKTKVGDFATPNIEKIAAAEPEVILATSGMQDAVVKSLEKLGIKVLVTDPVTIEGTMAGIRRTARVLGVEGEAGDRIEALQKRVDQVRDKAAGLEKRKLFFEVYNQPLTTAGGGTLIDSMIRDAGGTNIGAAAGSQFPQYSQEQLFNENPYAYVAVEGTQATPRDISGRPGYAKLTAVAEGRVFVVLDNLFVRSGPRVVEGLEILARILHPEEFGRYEGSQK